MEDNGESYTAKGVYMSDQEFTTRVRAMERKLYRIAHAILWSDADCADAIQEAVFKGWMKRGGLRNEAYFETWMVRILINECKNLIRRSKHAPLPLDDDVRAAGGEPGVDLHLRAALQQLPEKYRTVLLLHHLEGYPLNEVGQILKLTPQLVKSRLHQARKLLRKNLNAGDESA